jgi:hypothetical protein
MAKVPSSAAANFDSTAGGQDVYLDHLTKVMPSLARRSIHTSHDPTRYSLLHIHLYSKAPLADCQVDFSFKFLPAV